MTLYTNAYLWINDAWTAQPAALLVDNGIITDILYHNLPTNVASINLYGAYCYPGFTDTHTHSFEGGLYSLGVDLSVVRTIPELLALLGANKHNSADTLFAWQLDEAQLAEKRFPTIAELDSVINLRPLVLRRIDGHSCMLNTAARALVPGLTTKDEILRGTENDHAVHYFHKQIQPDTILQAYQAAAKNRLTRWLYGHSHYDWRRR